MTPQDFCYWLQGYFELATAGAHALDAEQVKSIKNHLALVFHHSIDTAQAGDPALLQSIHDGRVKPPSHLYHQPEGLPPGVMVRC